MNINCGSQKFGIDVEPNDTITDVKEKLLHKSGLELLQLDSGIDYKGRRRDFTFRNCFALRHAPMAPVQIVFGDSLHYTKMMARDRQRKYHAEHGNGAVDSARTIALHLDAAGVLQIFRFATALRRACDDVTAERQQLFVTTKNIEYRMARLSASTRRIERGDDQSEASLALGIVGAHAHTTGL